MVQALPIPAPPPTATNPAVTTPRPEAQQPTNGAVVAFSSAAVGQSGTAGGTEEQNERGSDQQEQGEREAQPFLPRPADQNRGQNLDIVA